ncbi:hypothetical protein LINPERHAP1_LOCUS31392 [Linum perenne]
MNSAADSGIIRDDQGYFVQAFFANLGTYSIMRAELRGIIEGMEIALSNGIKKLRILLDSRAEVTTLTNPTDEAKCQPTCWIGPHLLAFLSYLPRC